MVAIKQLAPNDIKPGARSRLKFELPDDFTLFFILL